MFSELARAFRLPSRFSPAKRPLTIFASLWARRGGGIADLGILLSTVAREEVVIRERLQPGSLSDRQAPALGRVVVDVIVPILSDMRDDGCGRIPGALHPESVLERDDLRGPPFLCHVVVIWKQPWREYVETRRVLG